MLTHPLVSLNSIVDTNCDVISLYKTNFFPPLLREHPPHALNCVITNIIDPRTDIQTIRNIMNDPNIRVSLGVDMSMIGFPGRDYLNFCANNIKNHKVAVVGGLGLNGRHGSAILRSQIQTLENFMMMAKSNLKLVRIFSINMNEITYQVIRNTLGTEHPVYLPDFTGGPTEAKRVFSTFNHGNIGLSRGTCDPTSALLQTIKEIPLDKIYPRIQCSKSSNFI